MNYALPVGFKNFFLYLQLRALQTNKSIRPPAQRERHVLETQGLHACVGMLGLQHVHDAICLKLVCKYFCSRLAIARRYVFMSSAADSLEELWLRASSTPSRALLVWETSSGASSFKCLRARLVKHVLFSHMFYSVCVLVIHVLGCRGKSDPQ